MPLTSELGESDLRCVLFQYKCIFSSLGGAPELCTEFRYLASESRKLGRKVIDRTNLTVFQEPGTYIIQYRHLIPAPGPGMVLADI